MTAADDAYTAAVQRIARAKKAGETALDFSGPAFRALDHLPPEISGLTALHSLTLANTQVSDLSPLDNLTALEALYVVNTQVSDLSPLVSLTALEGLSLANTQVSDLSPLTNLTALEILNVANTQVSDLRPIAKLPNLATPAASLYFPGTPFANATPETRRLAAIEDEEQRTHETLAFLNTLPPWPEPLPWDVETAQAKASSDAPAPAPEQDPTLPLIWGENGFQFFVDSIGMDPVTQTALADLRALLDTLRRQAGNHHEDLYRLAEDMRARCEPVNGVLNAVSLHLSFQTLERLHAGRAARTTALDDEIVTTLESILITAPGVTLADERVGVLIRRQDANRAAPAPGIDTARAKAVLTTLQHPDAPFAPEVKDLAAQANADGPQDRTTATRPILARNIFVAVGRSLAGTLTAGAIGGPVGSFVYENRATLLSYAYSLGTDAAVWFVRVLKDLGLATGGLPF